MAYKNIKEILPANLLKEVQKYIDGEYIYIHVKLIIRNFGVKILILKV